MVIPECFRILGFDTVPTTTEEVCALYKEFAKTLHPDAGGSDEDFKRINDAMQMAIVHFEEIDRTNR
jgi:curved DNA-binding protein CbpA